MTTMRTARPGWRGATVRTRRPGGAQKCTAESRLDANPAKPQRGAPLSQVSPHSTSPTRRWMPSHAVHLTEGRGGGDDQSAQRPTARVHPPRTAPTIPQRAPVALAGPAVGPSQRATHRAGTPSGSTPASTQRAGTEPHDAEQPRGAMQSRTVRRDGPRSSPVPDQYTTRATRWPR